MKIWTPLFSLAALCVAIGSDAQTLLSSPSVSGNVTSTATSIDYRYTRHTTAGSGRGGHGSTYYTWDPYTDQQVVTSAAMKLNGSSGAAVAIGTFYAPTYSASTSGATSFANSTDSGVFTATFTDSTTLNTPQVAHQKVTVGAQDSVSFYVTLNDFTDVTVTATGSANGSVTVYGTLDEGSGPVLGLNGPGTVSTSASLLPAGCTIKCTFSAGAIQYTQQNTLLAIGTTNSSYSIKVTFHRSAGN